MQKSSTRAKGVLQSRQTWFQIQVSAFHNHVGVGAQYLVLKHRVDANRNRNSSSWNAALLDWDQQNFIKIINFKYLFNSYFFSSISTKGCNLVYSFDHIYVINILFYSVEKKRKLWNHHPSCTDPLYTCTYMQNGKKNKTNEWG